MARSSIDLAKHIIYLLSKKPEDYPINNTKVQKALYLYVGLGLLFGINKLHIINELPNAFDNGPVFPDVYKMIKQCESCKKHISTLGIDFSSILLEEEKEIMLKVIEIAGTASGGKLSAWTHLHGSPWDIVYNQMAAKYAKIPLELIKEYFQEIDEKYRWKKEN
jgi:uncharacterized phage-associated protein